MERYLLLLLLAHHIPGPGHLRQRLPRGHFLRQHIVDRVSLTARSNTEMNACMHGRETKKEWWCVAYLELILDGLGAALQGAVGQQRQTRPKRELRCV